jgi:hypothetical protein
MFEDMTASDMERSFSGCWVGYHDNRGYVCPSYVMGIEHNEEGVPCLLLQPYNSANNSMQRKLLPLADPQLMLDHPDSGLYTDGHKTVNFTRVPQRQWHRGIKPSLIQLAGDVTDLREALHIVLNPAPYLSLEQAIAAAKTNRTGAALSLLTGVKQVGDDVVVYVRDSAVAVVDQETLTIDCDPRIAAILGGKHENL